MRKILLVSTTVLTGCLGSPGYQAPTMRVGPEYATATTVAAASPTADSCSTESTAIAAPRSVHYTAAMPVAPFWRTLDDTVLTALVEEALRANTDVQIAESRLTRTRASRRLAAFDLVPTVTASGSSLRSQASIAQLPGFGGQLPPQQLWDVGFDASWELDLFGRVSRNVRAQGARVADAVARAGGSTRKADLSLVNLAALVSDGEQVVVPRRGAGVTAAGGAGGGVAGVSGASGIPMGPVHLNGATVEQLDALPGIGPVTAQKIVDYRQKHGAFTSVDELDAVSGIGPARLDQLRDLVAP